MKVLFGIVFRGSYCGRKVSIKVLKNQEYINKEEKTEFKKMEVYFMEKMKHETIVEFIGAVYVPEKYQ